MLIVSQNADVALAVNELIPPRSLLVASIEIVVAGAAYSVRHGGESIREVIDELSTQSMPLIFTRIDGSDRSIIVSSFTAIDDARPAAAAAVADAGLAAFNRRTGWTNMKGKPPPSHANASALAVQMNDARRLVGAKLH